MNPKVGYINMMQPLCNTYWFSTFTNQTQTCPLIEVPKQQTGLGRLTPRLPGQPKRFTPCSVMEAPNLGR